MIETYQINGVCLEYDDDTHTYICDGLIVPSVTQLLSVRFGGKYADVDSQTLKRAAERGTAIHQAIEDYCRTGAEDGSKELHNFKFLQKRYGFMALENETPIIIFENMEPIAAGRLDLVLDIDGETAIADIKTTSTLDKEYLGYQLNLYRLGYLQSYGGDISRLYGIHLRDDTRKLIQIPIIKKACDEILVEYERKGYE